MKGINISSAFLFFVNVINNQSFVHNIIVKLFSHKLLQIIQFDTRIEKYSYYLMGIHLWYICLDNSVFHKFLMNNWNFLRFSRSK